MINAQKPVTSTASLACVGTTNLANRKILIIRNIGVQDVYYGYSAANAASDKGQLLAPYESRAWFWDLMDGVPSAVYVACAAGKTSTIAVEEG